VISRIITLLLGGATIWLLINAIQEFSLLTWAIAFCL
jgi:hypothetical protein